MPAEAPARRKLTCPACAARRAAGLAPLERTLGFEVIDWLEAMLVHGPGDVQGEPYRLDDELKHVVLHLYELDAHGRRVVRRGFLSRPKGRSKSELAGALSAAELCGPVRFDGNNARGLPTGRPVKGAQVVAYATEEGQAGTTYSTAAFMLGEGPAVNELGLDIGLSRTYLEGGGVMLAETSGATSAEGGRTTHAVFDETAYWITRELRRLHAVVRRNLGKRALAEAWSFETSAAWQPGEDSVAEVLYRHWSALVAEGAADPTIYVDHREAPELDLDDDDELEAGLRQVYGPAAAWLDLPRIMAEIRDPQTDPKEARRFWLNQPSIAADAWLEPGQVERAAGPRPGTGGVTAGGVTGDGQVVTLGFDGSLSDDATALVACTLGDEPQLRDARRLGGRPDRERRRARRLGRRLRRRRRGGRRRLFRVRRRARLLRPGLLVAADRRLGGRVRRRGRARVLDGARRADRAGRGLDTHGARDRGAPTRRRPAARAAPEKRAHPLDPLRADVA